MSVTSERKNARYPVSLRETEALFVFLMLFIIAVCSGSKAVDWSAASAVFLGFVDAQISFDLAEHQTKSGGQEGAKKLHNIYVLKELGWVVTFLLLQSWPLLFGAIIFSLYPTIRRWLSSRQAFRETKVQSLEEFCPL